MPDRPAPTDVPALAAVSRLDVAVAIGGALAVVLTGPTDQLGSMVLLLIGCAALAWRRARPLPSALVVAIVVTAAWLKPVDDGAKAWVVVAGGAVAALSVASVVAFGSRWPAWVTLPASLIGAFLAGAVASGVAFTQAMTAAFAVALLAWTFGQWRASQSRYVASLLERTRRAEHEREQESKLVLAEERARIARELHDVVAHSLAVMTAQADGARYALATSPELAADALRTVADTGRAAMGDMRGLLDVLTGDEVTATSDLRPQPGISDLADLLDTVRASGLPVSWRTSGPPQQLPAGAQLAVFRVVQESLTNVIRHAGGDATATVELDWSAHELQVRVTDDGRGRPLAADPPGHGLVGMRERVAQLGGAVRAEPGPDRGFTVAASIPLDTPAVASVP